MGKAERIRRMNAREKIAAQQALARRAEARRRMFLASGSVLGVLVIVVVLIIVKSASNTPAGASSGPGASTATTASVINEATSVPATTLNAVGKGTVDPLIATKGQPALTSGGKPEILYVGAEYCPFCAAERWGMVVALSRFGTFSGLHLIHSTSNDIYSNTSTFSFYKSTYTSNYVKFDPVEWYSEKALKSGGYATLQAPSKAESTLMAKYDAPPYISSSEAGSFPFVDIGNQYLVLGAQYAPSDLGTTQSIDPTHYGLTWSQIAGDLKNPASPVAQDIDGVANSITAAICKITNNAPAAVCNSAAAKAGAGSL
ncbi:MAG TPA: DUF929 family protein [Streptosporangiaceae bacterium]|nr:DUF929 family protein [Streptosporangiaceae bacterium]